MNCRKILYIQITGIDYTVPDVLIPWYPGYPEVIATYTMGTYCPGCGATTGLLSKPYNINYESACEIGKSLQVVLLTTFLFQCKMVAQLRIRCKIWQLELQQKQHWQLQRLMWVL
jgi:hypothetical protein